jgi:hypothetical protein
MNADAARLPSKEHVHFRRFPAVMSRRARQSGCRVAASDLAAFPTVEGHVGIGNQRNDEGCLQLKVLFLWRQQRPEHFGKDVGLAHETEVGGV